MDETHNIPHLLKAAAGSNAVNAKLKYVIIGTVTIGQGGASVCLGASFLFHTAFVWSIVCINCSILRNLRETLFARKKILNSGQQVILQECNVVE